MGIYIKGMETPTRCGRCDMRIAIYDDGAFDHYECCITAAIIDNVGEKMEDCPLIPVPSHGRLGDLDALKERVTKRLYSSNHGSMAEAYYAALIDLIDTAPTIIPEEEEENDEQRSI